MRSWGNASYAPRGRSLNFRGSSTAREMGSGAYVGGTTNIQGTLGPDFGLPCRQKESPDSSHPRDSKCSPVFCILSSLQPQTHSPLWCRAQQERGSWLSPAWVRAPSLCSCVMVRKCLDPSGFCFPSGDLTGDLRVQNAALSTLRGP